jgi:hypothetical protein
MEGLFFSAPQLDCFLILPEEGVCSLLSIVTSFDDIEE